MHRLMKKSCILGHPNVHSTVGHILNNCDIQNYACKSCIKYIVSYKSCYTWYKLFYIIVHNEDLSNTNVIIFTFHIYLA